MTPRRRSLVLECDGVVQARPGAVLDAVERLELPRVRGDSAWARVDHEAGTIAFGGTWWFAGEYAVRPHPDGCLLTYRVHDVAEQASWLVPLVHGLFGGFRRRQRAGFAGLLRRVGEALGAEVRVVE